MRIYRDRREAGRVLAQALTDYRGNREGLVLGLPRGGVVLAEVVAQALKLPLDVILLRKLPYPENPELAVGAIAEDGSLYLNPEFQSISGQHPEWLQPILREQMAIIHQRAKIYRSHRRPHPIRGRTVILVDDGMATGATMRVAIHAVQSAGASQTVVAVPIASPSTVRELQGEADVVVALETPWEFCAVGQAYESFAQVTDEEVCEILDRNG
jgi:putative phosphoribosyl transferase